MVIACSPVFPATCPASRGTSPAIGSANAHSRDFAPLPRAAPQSRYPAPAISRDNCPSTVNSPHPAAACSPPPACQSPACRHSPYAALPPARGRLRTDYSRNFAQFPLAGAADKEKCRPGPPAAPAPQPASFAKPAASATQIAETPSHFRAAPLASQFAPIALPAKPQSVTTAPGLLDDFSAPPPPCSIHATPALPPRRRRKTPHATPAPPILPPSHPEKSSRAVHSERSFRTSQLRAAGRRQHLSQILLRVEQSILGGRLGNLQHARDLRVAEPFHLIQQKYIALMLRQCGDGPLQRQPQGRMRTGRARFQRRGILAGVIDDILPAPHAPPSHVVASIHQYAKRPGNERRLPAKTINPPLHFQKCFLHRVFRITRRRQQIARQVFHPRALLPVQLLVRVQVAPLARRSQRQILGIRRRVRG